MDSDPTVEYAAVVNAALAPYAWRELTAQMVARRVVAALDQHSLTTLLAAIPGARLMSMHPLEPAALDDSRVAVLADMLERHRWRDYTLDSLALQMLGTLAAWQLDRDRLDAELRQLLDES